MHELSIFENGLVPVYTTDKGVQVVYGRELWEVLEVKSKFADWIKNRFQECEAVENEDFESFSKILENGGKSKEYIITLDIAKEMAMLERNEIGKRVRKYFIAVERKYKQETEPKGEKLIALALIEANKVINDQETKIRELQPKADYTDNVLKSGKLYCTTQIAKDFRLSAQQLNNLLHFLGIQYKVNGQWVLYAKYQQFGYAQSTTEPNSNGTGYYTQLKWTEKGRKFIYEKLKNFNNILPVLEMDKYYEDAYKKIGWL